MIVAEFATAADGVAREMALLARAQPAILLWRSAVPALVLPAPLLRRPDMQQAAAQAAAAGCAVVPRFTGGGIVPQGPGTLNLALVLPAKRAFRLEDGFGLICGAVTEALARFDIKSTTGACDNAFCDGKWNVLAEGRKFAGTAQRWSHRPDGPTVLVHAALLTAMPDAALWPVMDHLHRAAFPGSAGLRPEAHIALSALIGDRANPQNFPGALARAAEDRLASMTRRANEAA